MHEVRQLVAEGRSNDIVVTKKATSRTANARSLGLTALGVALSRGRDGR